MRNFIFLFFFFCLAGSCKTYSYFTTGNDLSNQDCQVFLADGTSINGKITVQFETGHDVDKYLKILTADNAEKKILFTDILYYKHKEECYFLKETNLEPYNIFYKDKIYTPNIHNVLFMKRLTAENEKMQLFELFKPKANTPDGIDQYDYYISFANENRFAAWSIRGNKFFPNFEEKMSEAVADCPALAEKVKQKMKAYTIKQFSIDANKYEVVKRIVDEYNACKGSYNSQ